MNRIAPLRPLRVAALVKQIPKIERMSLGADGRLQRDGLPMHLNDYCRRAVAKGHEIARASGGTLTVITLGPPIAENVLREAIAFGADSGIHVTDTAFAGSDTGATARALARAVEKVGPFDLILMGRSSLDADTGQVPPAVAQLLGLPFCAGVRELTLDGDLLRLRLEHDDEWVNAEVALPAVLSCAERLCDPCKIKEPDVWATVDGSKIERLTATDLGAGPWGQAASSTVVGEVRGIEVRRQRLLLDGPLDEQIAKAREFLQERRIFGAEATDSRSPGVPVRAAALDGPVVAVLLERGRARIGRELLGTAAGLANEIGGHVVAVGRLPGTIRRLSAWGADAIVSLEGGMVEEDLARTIVQWCGRVRPWALLAPSTAWGREIASRIATALGAGLTGDAVGLRVRGGRLIADKLAFGGAMLAEITCTSETQMATVRAGVLPLLTPREGRHLHIESLRTDTLSRLRISGREREDDSIELSRASFVIGAGQGIQPEDYPILEELRRQLGAVLCATRKVTDKGWMPRARQVGITGHSIAPRLFISVGASGKFNHTIGIRGAHTVLAVNTDPAADIFKWADVGIVGDWKAVMEALSPALNSMRVRAS